MIGFEPGSSGIGSERAVNCATTTTPLLLSLFAFITQNANLGPIH